MGPFMLWAYWWKLLQVRCCHRITHRYLSLVSFFSYDFSLIFHDYLSSDRNALSFSSPLLFLPSLWCHLKVGSRCLEDPLRNHPEHITPSISNHCPFTFMYNRSSLFLNILLIGMNSKIAMCFPGTMLTYFKVYRIVHRHYNQIRGSGILQNFCQPAID